LLLAWLEEASHQCDVFRDGNAFIRAYKQDLYDLALLDWMVPKLSGIEVLRHLRENVDAVVPVVFITQRDSEDDIVKALEAGADDYMTKPVRHKETMARVNAIARRMGFGDENTSEHYSFPRFKIDTRLRQVMLTDTIVEMTQDEYELTLFIFKNLSRVISRGHLLEMVWGYQFATQYSDC
jgi:two-component system response regulator RegX3